MKMIIKSSIMVACCGKTHRFGFELQALEWALGHIIVHHPTEKKKLEQRARQMAMSQNGCGYYDTGTGETGGWFTATDLFLRSWRLEAVKELYFDMD